jgi:type I restriction enzyme M protein
MTTPASTSIVLPDDGISYGDYVEQLTYLLSIKIDDESVHLPGKLGDIPMVYIVASLDIHERFQLFFTAAEIAEARRRLEELEYHE